jgi:hypothetical protein
MTEMDDIVDSNEIARILAYGDRHTAANLCRSGRLKTATKKGNSWVASRWEVVQYKAEMLLGRKKIKGKIS